MFALWWREHAGEGRGQVIDLAIYEPLFWILGPQALVYDQLGIVQERTGNAAPFAAPRNAYQAKDGRWLGLSASAQSIAERVMKIVGREDLVEEPWFRDHAGRVEHADELDAIIQEWIGAPHDGGGARGIRRARGRDRARSTRSPTSSPTRSTRRRETITTVEHPRARAGEDAERDPDASARRRAASTIQGPELGEHNREVYVGELGLTEEELARLRRGRGDLTCRATSSGSGWTSSARASTRRRRSSGSAGAPRRSSSTARAASAPAPASGRARRCSSSTWRSRSTTRRTRSAATRAPQSRRSHGSCPSLARPRFPSSSPRRPTTRMERTRHLRREGPGAARAPARRPGRRDRSAARAGRGRDRDHEEVRILLLPDEPGVAARVRGHRHGDPHGMLDLWVRAGGGARRASRTATA